MRRSLPLQRHRFGMKPETLNIQVGAIVWATGWDPYEAEKIDYLGFEDTPNVLTSVMFEQSCGPQWYLPGGKLVRPSDARSQKCSIRAVRRVQRRKSSGLLFRCMLLASLKQSTYIRKRVPDSKAFIYYIDIRAMGK